MKAISPATATSNSPSHEEELIKHLECLSGVLNELVRREVGSGLPLWLRQGLREADYHLLAAQTALLDCTLAADSDAGIRV